MKVFAFNTRWLLSVALAIGLATWAGCRPFNFPRTPPLATSTAPAPQTAPSAASP
jgi:hypothetical protein